MEDGKFEVGDVLRPGKRWPSTNKKFGDLFTVMTVEHDAMTMVSNWGGTFRGFTIYSDVSLFELVHSVSTPLEDDYDAVLSKIIGG